MHDSSSTSRRLQWNSNTPTMPRGSVTPLMLILTETDLGLQEVIGILEILGLILEGSTLVGVIMVPDHAITDTHFPTSFKSIS